MHNFVKHARSVAMDRLSVASYVGDCLGSELSI